MFKCFCVVVVTFLRFAPGMDQRPLRFVWLVDYPYGARRYFQDDVRRRCAFSREHKAWIQDLLKESDSSHLLQMGASLRAHSFQVRGLAEVQVGKEHNDFCIWDREETAMHSYHCFQHDVCCLHVEKWHSCLGSPTLSSRRSQDKRCTARTNCSPVTLNRPLFHSAVDLSTLDLVNGGEVEQNAGSFLASKGINPASVPCMFVNDAILQLISLSEWRSLMVSRASKFMNLISNPSDVFLNFVQDAAKEEDVELPPVDAKFEKE